MFIIGNFIATIAKIVHLVFNLYIFIVIARVLLSWFPQYSHASWAKTLYNVTDPILIKMRRYIPTFGGLDLTPMILILVIYFLDDFLVKTLLSIASALQ